MFAVKARDLSLDPQHPCKEPYMVAQSYNPSGEIEAEGPATWLPANLLHW